ncbi:MAG: SRPBCC family protein [Acinetobacter sp.]|jgi:uncharacterized protein YndB with AHSA1/START domain|nr:MAG: SRPBCC family protein [Acinetobacter sp.]
MNKKITVKQKFNRPVAEVFDLLSKHATYNAMFFPVQVVRVQDAADPQRPDGLGSIRRMGFGKIKPLQEQITKVEENQLIEYKLIDNPLVKHHLGRLAFQSVSDQATLVTYTIEFEGKIPLSSLIVLSQLKFVVTLGMAKLAKNMK